MDHSERSVAALAAIVARRRTSGERASPVPPPGHSTIQPSSGCYELVAQQCSTVSSELELYGYSRV